MSLENNPLWKQIKSQGVEIGGSEVRFENPSLNLDEAFERANNTTKAKHAAELAAKQPKKGGNGLYGLLDTMQKMYAAAGVDGLSRTEVTALRQQVRSIIPNYIVPGRQSGAFLNSMLDAEFDAQDSNYADYNTYMLRHYANLQQPAINSEPAETTTSKSAPQNNDANAPKSLKDKIVDFSTSVVAGFASGYTDAAAGLEDAVQLYTSDTAEGGLLQGVADTVESGIGEFGDTNNVWGRSIGNALSFVVGGGFLIKGAAKLLGTGSARLAGGLGTAAAGSAGGTNAALNELYNSEEWTAIKAEMELKGYRGDDVQNLVAGGAALIGMSEALLPAFGIFTKPVFKALKKSPNKFVVNISDALAVRNRLNPWARSTLKSASIEGVQEVMADIAMDAHLKAAYDTDREVGASAEESLLAGMLAGGVAETAVRIFIGSSRRLPQSTSTEQPNEPLPDADTAPTADTPIDDGFVPLTEANYAALRENGSHVLRPGELARVQGMIGKSVSFTAEDGEVYNGVLSTTDTHFIISPPLVENSDGQKVRSSFTILLSRDQVGRVTYARDKLKDAKSVEGYPVKLPEENGGGVVNLTRASTRGKKARTLLAGDFMLSDRDVELVRDYVQTNGISKKRKTPIDIEQLRRDAAIVALDGAEIEIISSSGGTSNTRSAVIEVVIDPDNPEPIFTYRDKTESGSNPQVLPTRALVEAYNRAPNEPMRVRLTDEGSRQVIIGESVVSDSQPRERLGDGDTSALLNELSDGYDTPNAPSNGDTSGFTSIRPGEMGTPVSDANGSFAIDPAQFDIGYYDRLRQGVKEADLAVRGNKIRGVNPAPKDNKLKKIARGLTSGGGLANSRDLLIRHQTDIGDTKVMFEKVGRAIVAADKASLGVAADINRANIADTGANYRSLTTEQRRVIDDAFGGNDDAFNSLGPAMQSVVSKMRTEVDSNSQKIAGLFNSVIMELEANRTANNYAQISNAAFNLAKIRNRIIDNIGSYKHVRYSVYMDPDAMENARNDIEGQERAISALSRALAARSKSGRGSRIENPDSEARDIINALLNTSVDLSSTEMGMLKDLARLSGSHALRRKDLNIPEVKELLGEIRDPAINYAATLRAQAKIASNLNASKFILEEGLRDGWVSVDGAKPGFVLIPPASGLGDYGLGGVHVAADFARGITEELQMNQKRTGWFFDMVHLGNGLVKTGQILNVDTGVINFLGSAMINWVNGDFNPTYLPSAIRTAADSFSNKGNASEYNKLLREYGVINDAVPVETLNFYLQEIADVFGGLPRTKRGDRVVDNVTVPLRKVTEGFKTAWQFGDDFFKIIAFESNRARLSSMRNKSLDDPAVIQESANRVRDLYPTDSKAPRLVKDLRAFPLSGPFIVFASEMVRVSGNWARYTSRDLKDPQTRQMGISRMLAAMSAVAAFEGLSDMLSSQTSGLDEQERDAMEKLDTHYERGSKWMYTGVNADGGYNRVNLSQYNPYAVWARPLRAMLDGDINEDGVKGRWGSVLSLLAEPAVGLELGVSAAIDYAEALSSTDSPSRRKEALGKLIKDIAPKQVTQLVEFYNALHGEMDKDYRTIDPTQKGARIIGARYNTTYPIDKLIRKRREFQYRMSDLRSANASQFRGENLSRGEDEVTKNILDNFTVASRAYVDLLDAVEAAQTLGLSTEEIRAGLRGKNPESSNGYGMTNKEVDTLISALIAGRPPAPEFFKLPDNAGSGAIESRRIQGTSNQRNSTGAFSVPVDSGRREDLRVIIDRIKNKTNNQ